MIRVYCRAGKVLASWEVDTDDAQEAIKAIEQVRVEEKLTGAALAVVK